MTQRFWIILVCVLVLLGLYWTRYQVVELSGVGGYYKINRLTGSATLVAGTFSQPVRSIAETRVEIQRQQEKKQGGAPEAPGLQPQAPQPPQR